MAYIKCKYEIPYCTFAQIYLDTEFDKYVCFNADGCASDFCKRFSEIDDERIGSSCKHVGYKAYLIEKEVKSYELSDTELHFRGNCIPVDYMTELVIDGKEYAFKYGPDFDRYLPPRVIDWEESEDTK